MKALLVASLFALFAAGCTSMTEHPSLSSTTYQMTLSGVPTTPVASGTQFNVSVVAAMATGQGDQTHASDHIGAHFWNRTSPNPSTDVANGTTCVHHTGLLPGSYTATCTAPLAPGTYYIRAHARIIDNGTTYQWWSAEQTFTVA